jgi:hypothetical protein
MSYLFLQIGHSPQRPDWLAEVVGFELRNVVAKYPFERSHRFPGIQPNSSDGDYSRLSCGVAERSSGPSQQGLARHGGKNPRTVCGCQPVDVMIVAMVAPLGRRGSPSSCACFEFARPLCSPLRPVVGRTLDEAARRSEMGRWRPARSSRPATVLGCRQLSRFQGTWVIVRQHVNFSDDGVASTHRFLILDSFFAD